MDYEPENASKWLSKSIHAAKISYLFASVLTLISAASFVMFSWYLSVFANLWLTEGQIMTHNLFYASGFLAGRYVFAHVASVINYDAGNSIVAQLKTKLYPLLLNTSQHDSIASTLFVTRTSDDLKPYYAFFIPYALASVLVGTFLLVVCFWFDKWVGFILLATFMVIPMQMVVIGVGAESLHKKHIHLFVKYSAVFYNRLHTIAEIVNLNNLKAQNNFLAQKSSALNTATTNVMRVAILSSAVLELFVTIAIAAVAIYLGMSLMGIMPGPNYGKGYDFGVALFLLMLSPYFYFYLRKFVASYHDRNRAIAAAKLLMPVLNAHKPASEVDEHEHLQSFIVHNLSFAYPQSAIKVLNNIQITLPTKGIVLIKGISGSGKSTLLKIFANSLSVSEGSISINNNTNTWSQQWLQVNTSYMNQFPFIFDGSLRYNVFLNNASEHNNAYPAFLNKIIEKKQAGWETMLSHNGNQLSGGERQLVTLARMMLYPKPIALMDEPTANLDATTVDTIVEQIKIFATESLVIIASHEDKFDAIATQTLTLNWGEQMH